MRRETDHGGGRRRDLPQFLCDRHQNPTSFTGTYPLPGRRTDDSRSGWTLGYPDPID